MIKTENNALHPTATFTNQNYFMASLPSLSRSELGSPLALACLLAVLSSSSSTTVKGAVVVSDNFARDISALGGTAPQFDSITPTEKYNTGYYTDTFETKAATGARDKYGSDLTNLYVGALTTGHIYTLSLTVNNGEPSPGSTLFILGFNQLSTFEPDPSNPLLDKTQYYNIGGPSATLVQNGTATGYSAPGAQNPYASSSAYTSADGIAGTNTLTLVLNTSAPNWTIATYENGHQVGDSYTYSGNPTLDSIDFGGGSYFDSTHSFITNFSLDVTAAAVPEPSTWASLLLGMGALGFLMRRKSRAQA